MFYGYILKEDDRRRNWAAAPNREHLVSSRLDRRHRRAAPNDGNRHHDSQLVMTFEKIECNGGKVGWLCFPRRGGYRLKRTRQITPACCKNERRCMDEGTPAW